MIMNEIEQIDVGEGAGDALLAGCLGLFPHVRLRVTGQCMSPEINEGETVLIASPSRHTPRVGEIVLARHANGLRLHRLVWKWPLCSRRLFWLTKADRARFCDPRIAPGAVLGTVVAVESAGAERAWGKARVRRAGRSFAEGLAAWSRVRFGRFGRFGLRGKS